jgi:triacylglycerol esterase/lipase EstA (alpha/beta hydrolase family)
VQQLDPEGRDPALRRMVVIGHSQGGLLARLMVVRGDIRWWQEIHGTPLEDWGFDAEDEALVRRCIDFEPVTAISRVVFVSTPHRGSFVAGRGIAHFIAGLVRAPLEVARISGHVRDAQHDLPSELSGGGLTSVANMDPTNPFSQRLTTTAFGAGVHVHSIISVSGSGDPKTGNDGVVEYSSAHLDEAESELIVPSSHSCQGHPLTVLELRRILRLAVGLPATRTIP